MTLAEVIDTLQTWIEKADDEYDREEMGRVAGLKEALHEIKKIELCEDAISREEVLEALRTMYDTHIIETEDGDEYIDYNDTVYEIEQLPPVKPAEKMGHWIDHKCSACGYGVMPWNDTPYCPNCGAKMREVKDADSD